MIAETVEDLMGWLLSYLYKPFETLKPKVRDVHIDASMRSEKCKADEIRPNLSPYCKLRILNSILNPIYLLNG